MAQNGRLFGRIIEGAYDSLIRYRRYSVELARIEMARFYFNSVRTFRLMARSFYFLLMLAGMSVLTLAGAHVFVFLAVPDKLLAVGGMVVFDFLLTAFLLWEVLSQRQWMKHARQHEWIMEVLCREATGNRSDRRDEAGERFSEREG